MQAQGGQAQAQAQAQQLVACILLVVRLPLRYPCVPPEVCVEDVMVVAAAAEVSRLVG